MGYVARQMLYGLAGRGGYFNKVLRTHPFAYWPLWEASGTVAQSLVNRAQDGTYSSDVSTWPPGTGIGDGYTAPYFDGTNDSINILTADLQSAFDGDTGTVCAWVRVANAGVWTDASDHYIVNFDAPGDYWIYTYKPAQPPPPSRILLQRGAVGIVGLVPTSTPATTEWFHVACTWDSVADELNIYLDGVRTFGAGGMNAWVGTLDAARIGGRAGGTRWEGWLQHVALWSRVLLPAEVTNLATL